MDTLLTEILRALRAVQGDGDYRAPCPLCQPTEDNSDRYRLIVSPGRARMVVCYCYYCAVDPEHRQATWWGRVRNRTKLPAGVADPAPPEEIRRQWAALDFAAVPQQPTADFDVLNSVYSNILNRLSLSDAHGRWLQRRGLDPAYAAAVGYRSSPDSDKKCGEVADAVGRECRSLIETVPGWWKGKLLLRRQAILIPCRDPQGRVVAIKQRLLDGKKGRMRLLSSSAFGGPKAVNICHCPFGVGSGNHQRLWITEGERKADVFWHLRSEPVIAMPGVGVWRLALATATEIATAGATVVVALDQDDAGRRATASVVRGMQRAGFEVEEAEWTDAKGLDDAVVRGRPITTKAASRLIEGGFTSHVRGQLPRQRRLRDNEIVQWLQQWGPTLRAEIDCYQPTVSKLIREGRVRIRAYTAKGQVVEAVNSK